MNFATAAQAAIYQKLNGAVSCAVYDEVPYLPSGAPETSFPYVVIGDDTVAAWNTDGKRGATVTVTLHIWTRARGHKQGKDIAGEIYDLLDRGSLTTAGGSVIDCLWEFAHFQREEDGKTRHGVVRYRLTLQEH